VETYGADALRIYEMFMAPFEQDIAWSTEGIQGAWRFLKRLWHLYGETFSQSADSQADDPVLRRLLHKTIRRMDERIEAFRFNTMVSTLMEFVNALSERQRTDAWHTRDFHTALETLLVLLAPAAPHIVEELWQLTGHAGSVHQQTWPAWDADLARDERVQIPVQINGRLREVIEVAYDASPEDIQREALSAEQVKQHLSGKSVKRVIYVPGKVLNVVTQ